MRLTSPNLSDSPQVSESPSSSCTRRDRRRRRRRRRPPPSPTPSSISPHSETPDSPTPANITENQFDSFSSLPANSTSSSPSAPPFYLYVVVHLPIFRGLPGECPIAHLTRFNGLFPSSNASSINLILRNFSITLLDDAALWYELAVEPYPSMSWDETKSSFLRAFRPPEFADRARTELTSLRQRDGESITSYHLRMQWILKRWPGHGLPESLVRGLFVDGLREEFHDLVKPSKPETLEEAVRLAMHWEGSRAVRKGGEMRCGFCEGRHGEKECEVRRRMKEEWMRRRVRGEERKSGGEGKEEEVVEEETLGRVVSIGSIGRRSQCQCSKHQCWKKYERSGSAVTARTVNADTAAAATTVPVGAVSVAEGIGRTMMAIGVYSLLIFLRIFT